MVIDDAQRVSLLRQRCLARKIQGWLDTSPLSAGSLRASEHAPSVLVRRGLLTRDRLRGLRFAIDEYELLAGRVQPPTYAESELAQAHEYLSRQPSIGGQTGHCELDLSELFAGGIAGIRARITSLKGQATEEQADTYESFLLALDGMEAMANNAAQAADAAIATAEPWRKAELEQISAACRHISLNPPQTFREAIQLLWLADLGVMFGDQVGLVVPGHLDRTLWPFYQADLAAWRVTREQALALIESLYILINEFIPDGLAMSVMVGGRDAGGRDVTNDLSYLCLEAIRRTKLIYPTVGICWHDGTPQALADLAVELISKGFPTPAFFNDATIQKGLRALGLPPQEACNYINSTCVEITPVGASNVWVASPYFNLCVYLLDEIAAQCGMGVPPMRSTGVSPVSDNQQQDAGKMPAAHEGETPSTHAGKMPATQFEDFLQAYYRRLAREIAAAVAVQDNCRRAERGVHGGTPLQSVFTRDCIARGQDINRGGATYNWVECSFVGMANLADSLEVIRDEVFERRTLTLAELRAALDADFAGMEPLRMRLLNGHPKYGNGAAEVD